METLRNELIESQKVRSDLLKWKLLIIAGVGGAALGFSSASPGPRNAHLALAILPLACAYVDLLCRHLSLRNKAIGLFFEHSFHSPSHLKQYEAFYAKLSSSAWKNYSLESLALLGLTVFISIAIIPIGILTGGGEDWSPYKWPTGLFYGSGLVGLVSAIGIQLWYVKLKRAARDWAFKELGQVRINVQPGGAPDRQETAPASR